MPQPTDQKLTEIAHTLIVEALPYSDIERVSIRAGGRPRMTTKAARLQVKIVAALRQAYNNGLADGVKAGITGTT